MSLTCAAMDASGRGIVAGNGIAIVPGVAYTNDYGVHWNDSLIVYVEISSSHIERLSAYRDDDVDVDVDAATLRVAFVTAASFLVRMERTCGPSDNGSRSGRSVDKVWASLLMAARYSDIDSDIDIDIDSDSDSNRI